MTDTKTFNADLRSLLERPGPFISLYLNTEGATGEGAEEIQLRWRGLRDRAIEHGADEGVLKLLDDLVPGVQRRANGLAAFIEGNSLAFRRLLSAPVEDGIFVGTLPHLVPLLDWQQDHPRYAVVLCDREGGEIHIVSGQQIEDTETIEGDQAPIQKVKPGGWSQRRFQQRAENSWEANAKHVADELGKIVSAEDIDFVVISGDVRAIQFLKENVDQVVASLLVELEGTPEVGIESIEEELGKVVDTQVAAATERLLQKFQEERGQADLAVEGVTQTLDALRRAQVDVLLIAPGRLSGGAWFSSEDLTQASPSRNGLTDIGIENVAEGDVADVLVRSAFGTGARVAIVPQELPDEQAPKEGVGGLLRYA